MKYSCLAATHGISINPEGTIDPCCQYRGYSHDAQRVMFTDYQKYKEAVIQPMLSDWQQGHKHEGCKKCYVEEAAGLQSLRNLFSKWYSNVGGEDILHAEVRLNNLCNLNCIMCFPRASSSVAAEVFQHQEKFSRYNITPAGPIPKLWKDSEYHDFLDQSLKKVKRVNITGGEPFMIPETVHILDALYSRREEVVVSFNTNLTSVPDSIISRLKEFKQGSICVSLEGIGAVNNYVRYPSNWNNIHANIELIREKLPHLTVSVNHTLQHTSVYGLPDLAKFCKENSIELLLTTVQGQEFLTLNSVTPADLAAFTDWAQSSTDLSPRIKEGLLSLIAESEYVPELKIRFHGYLDMLDSIRGTNHRVLFTKNY